MKILQQICRVISSQQTKPFPLYVLRSCARYYSSDDTIDRSFSSYAALNPYEPVRAPVIPTLSPDDVNAILQRNEVIHQFNPGSSVVSSYCSNQLSANNPVEDRRAEGACKLTDGLLFGVFDGHSGAQCAQVVSERLFNYIAAEILPYNTLLSVREKIENKELRLVKWLGDYHHPASPNTDVHHKSLVRYLRDNINMDMDSDDYIPDMLTTAFERLDKDLTTEALTHTDSIAFNDYCLRTAFSGACVNVAFIQGKDLFIANSGDCRTVMGIQMDNNQWSPIILSNDHNAYNGNELNRVKTAHPNEGTTVIRQERLLGELVPLRAFGDARFKWKGDIQKEIFRQWEKHAIPLPRNYYTPPYLTATPEVTHYDLTGKVGFLIIATDGLWDCLEPEKAVSLVGAHWEAMGQVGPYSPAPNATLRDICTALARRRYSLRPLDNNVATHLIRYALCGLGHEFDYDKLSASLSLPANVVRHYRDDITVSVVFFNGRD